MLKGICLLVLLIGMPQISSGSPNKSSLERALLKFSSLKHEAKSQCNIKSSAKDYEYREEFITCGLPTTKTGACAREIGRRSGEHSMQRTSIVTMDCTMCGLVVPVVGKIAGEFEDDYPETFDIIDYELSHLQTDLEFDFIKSTCTGFIQSQMNIRENNKTENSVPGNLARVDLERIEAVKGFEDLFSMQSEGGGDQYLFGDQAPEFKGNPWNGKNCGSNADEVAEIEQFKQGQNKVSDQVEVVSENKPTGFILKSDGLRPASKSSSKGRKPEKLTLKGLIPGLIGTLEYQMTSDEKNNINVEKEIEHFYQLKGIITKVKINERDVDFKIHHLIFDKINPLPDLERYLDLNINGARSTRLFKPTCDLTKSADQLNVSHIDENNQFKTTSYRINCELKNGRQTLSLVPRK